MWKNIEELDKSRMTVWSVALYAGNLRIQTHGLEYVTLIALLLQLWFHKCNSLLRDIYFACLLVRIKEKGKLV